MAGWGIASESGCVQPPIRFGKRASCSLALNPATDLQTLTPSERRTRFGGACGHSGCRSCGPRLAQRLLMPFANSVDHVMEPATRLLLIWPIVPIGPSGHPSYRGFLGAARQLALKMQRGDFGTFMLWCLVSEVAVLNVSQARPHLHLVFLRDNCGLVRIVGAILAAWRSLKGEFPKNEARRFGVQLAPKLRYLAKGNLGGYYGTSAGESCARFLLDPFEFHSQEMGAGYYRGGRLLANSMRRASRARARTREQFETSPAGDAIGVAHDLHLAASLPHDVALLAVQHIVRCPTCQRSGPCFLSRNGRDARGSQRWLCKHCRKTFRDRPISQRQAKNKEDRKLAGLIRRLVDSCGLSVNRAAKSAEIGRLRAQRLYERHAARWPTKSPHS